MGLDIYLFSSSDEEPRKEIADFRKLNALLAWVDTHVSTVENCQDVELGKEDFEKLLATLCKLNKSNCEALFPTQSGFFFGGGAYNEFYWDDVEELKTFCTDILKKYDFNNGKIIFWAWW